MSSDFFLTSTLVAPDINGICHIISEKQKFILNVPFCINSMSMKKQNQKGWEQPNSGNKIHGTSQGTSINPQKEAQRKALLLKQNSKGHPCLFLLFQGEKRKT